MLKASTTRVIELAGAGNEAFFNADTHRYARSTRSLQVVVGGDVETEAAYGGLVTLTVQTPLGRASAVLHTEDALRIGQALIAYADRAGAR